MKQLRATTPFPLYESFFELGNFQGIDNFIEVARSQPQGIDTPFNQNDGKTALHWAAHYGCAVAVQSLINNRADAGAQDQRHRSPAVIAALNNRWGTAHYLLQNDQSIFRNRNYNIVLTIAFHHASKTPNTKTQTAIQKLLDLAKSHSFALRRCVYTKSITAFANYSCIHYAARLRDQTIFTELFEQSAFRGLRHSEFALLTCTLFKYQFAPTQLATILTTYAKHFYPVEQTLELDPLFLLLIYFITYENKDSDDYKNRLADFKSLLGMLKNNNIDKSKLKSFTRLFSAFGASERYHTMRESFLSLDSTDQQTQFSQFQSYLNQNADHPSLAELATSACNPQEPGIEFGSVASTAKNEDGSADDEVAGLGFDDFEEVGAVPLSDLRIRAGSTS